MLSSRDQKTVKERMQKLDLARRSLQALASQILTASKRTIFALHREEIAQAKKEWKTAQHTLREAKKIPQKEPRIRYDGAWRAAQEEFAEATLFLDYIEGRAIQSLKDTDEDPEIFIGALSDLTGELVRRAVRLAGHTAEERSDRTQENIEIEKLYRDIDATIEFFLTMDLTGTLRTKVDQAKQNLRKMEEIRYDLRLHARTT